METLDLHGDERWDLRKDVFLDEIDPSILDAFRLDVQREAAADGRQAASTRGDVGQESRQNLRVNVHLIRSFRHDDFS